MRSTAGGWAWPALLAAALSLAACADYYSYRPAVDMTGRTQADYDYDVLVCQQNARAVDAAAGAGIGAILGAALGAGIGAGIATAGSGAATGVAAGAGAGTVAGSVYGPAETELDKQNPHRHFIRECLKQRGYRLLDESAVQPAAPAPGAPNS